MEACASSNREEMKEWLRYLQEGPDSAQGTRTEGPRLGLSVALHLKSDGRCGGFGQETHLADCH